MCEAINIKEIHLLGHFLQITETDTILSLDGLLNANIVNIAYLMTV